MSMSDVELAAHLAEVAGRLLIEVRASGMLSLKALGKAPYNLVGHSRGGYVVAPEQMVNQLIQALDDQVFIRAKATKFRVVTAASSNPCGNSVGKSFKLCTARSTFPSARASSISFVNMPLVPTLASATNMCCGRFGRW
mgnify:CR=1 FL=1